MNVKIKSEEENKIEIDLLLHSTGSLARNSTMRCFLL